MSKAAYEKLTLEVDENFGFYILVCIRIIRYTTYRIECSLFNSLLEYPVLTKNFYCGLPLPFLLSSG